MAEEKDLKELESIETINGYAKEYSEDGFWAKVKKSAAKAGEAVIFNALKLYYALISNKTPWEHKTAIVGALGYLILPIDLIPDAIIGVGYTDDAAALMAALKFVSDDITPEIIAKAEQKTKDFFGSEDEKVALNE